MSSYKIFNKYICSCGMPFENQRLLNSHYQRKPSHRPANEDIVMEDAANRASNGEPRKFI